MQTLTWEEWCRDYRPIKNTIVDGASYDGFMFETYDRELQTVQEAARADPNKVWTLLSEGGSVWIGDGIHFVNRLGYFITEVPRKNNDEFVVDECTFGHDLDLDEETEERIEEWEHNE